MLKKWWPFPFKDAGDMMALHDGPFTFTTLTFPGTTCLQRWWQRQAQKTPWTCLFKVDSKRFCKVHCPPSCLPSDTQRVYVWPLEVSQRIIHKHNMASWTFVWLPPPHTSLMVYHNACPLFCRHIPESSTLSFEVSQTTAYLKRFGYEQTDGVTVFVPSYLDNPQKIPGTRLISYELPTITKPIAPLSLPPSLKKERFKRRLPVYRQNGLVISLMILMVGTTRTAWHTKELIQKHHVIQTLILRPFSETEQAFLKTVPTCVNTSSLPHINTWRETVSRILETRPHVLQWAYNALILEFNSTLTKAEKNSLTGKLKAFSSIWQGNALRIDMHDE